MTAIEPNEDGEAPRATERQRTAPLHGGVDRDRAEDPGLTPSPASQWLGSVIAAKQRENGEKPDPPKVGNQLAGRAESWQGSAGSS